MYNNLNDTNQNEVLWLLFLEGILDSVANDVKNEKLNNEIHDLKNEQNNNETIDVEGVVKDEKE